VRSIGGVYIEVDNYIQTPEFLTLMSEIIGILDLRYDPHYYGAGTHENLHGAGLDPHYDFNIHPKTAQHRRVNAIVYLNKDWDPAWKGSICFHSDAWDLKNDQVTEVAPNFNRCVIFETTERSWHSVPTIKLPANKRHLSRKSFTIYLYTDTRPPEEIVAEHGTVYVQFGLSPHIRLGRVLTQDDVDEIYANLEKRNSYLRNLYRREYQFSEQIDRQKNFIRELERATYIPILGYAKLNDVRTPLFHDRFMETKVDFSIELLRPVVALRFVGYRPENFDGEVDITLSVNNQAWTQTVAGGVFEIKLDFAEPLSGSADVTITASKAQRPPQSADERNLSIIVDRIELSH
jgi:2OG-Fe(II) oxygenase superfamily